MILKRVLAIFIIVYSIFFNIVIVYASDGVLKDWKYFIDLDLTGNSKYKTVSPNEDVYRHAMGDFSDVRIVDANKRIVPYFLQQGNVVAKQNYIIRECNLINSFKIKNYTYMDFKVAQLNETKYITATKIYFVVLGPTFMMHVEIYGSNDNMEWTHIKNDIVYKVENLNKRVVTLEKEQKYQFYRVGIPDYPEQVDLRKLQVACEEPESVKQLFIKSTPLKYEMEKRGRDTYVIVRNPDRLKISRIDLDVDGFFDRNFEVYMQKNDVATYTGVSGEIYNLQYKGVNIKDTDIRFPDNTVSSDVISIRIMDKKEKSLKIKNVEAKYFIDRIIFEATNNSTQYRMYFGNPNVEEPVNKLELSKEQIEHENMDMCESGILQRNNVVLFEGAFNEFTLLAMMGIALSVLAIAVVVFVLRSLAERKDG